MNGEPVNRTEKERPKIARYKGKPVTVREKHRLEKRAAREVLRQFYASFRRPWPR